MTATIWSKFFWADWLSDRQLRRCSPAARALWMDMLCLAAQSDPIGYLAEGEDGLDIEEIKRVTGLSKRTAQRLLGELERHNVFSRDPNGRIYSRRMVRDAADIERARCNGSKGGNPNLIKGARPPRVNPPVGPRDIPQSPEARVQAPADAPPGGPAVTQPLLERVAEALRTPLERLLKKPAWLVFGDMVADLRADGCDEERDLWPTIRRLAQRLKEPPASPAYFRDAILEARDHRLAEATTHAGAQEQADRLAIFHAEGVWSSKWGPRPETVSEARSGE